MEGAQITMIQLLIENESDLYNPYDPSQTRINEGVYHYLKKLLKPISDIRLEVVKSKE